MFPQSPVCACGSGLPAPGSENRPEQPAYQRAAVEYLPEERHREVAGRGLQPYGDKLDARLLEDQRRPEAHDRTHERHRDRGAHQRDKQRVVHAGHRHAKRNFGREAVDKAKAHHKAEEEHKRHLVQGKGQGGVGEAAGAQAGVVQLHRQHHEKGHQHTVNELLEFGLWHDRKSPPVVVPGQKRAKRKGAAYTHRLRLDDLFLPGYSV